MASSSATAATAQNAIAEREPLEVRGAAATAQGVHAAAEGPNIGVGKLYADEAAFQAAVDAYKQEKLKRAALVFHFQLYLDNI